MLERLVAKLERGLSYADETLYLKHLSEMSDSDLNQFLEQVSILRLLSALQNHVFGPHNRDATLELLSQDRVDLLGVNAKSRLIHALQIGRTTASKERAIRNLFLATVGEQLEQLKSNLEHMDHRNLFNLLYHDIDDADIREEILAHFQEGVASDLPLKILSDIDDTVYVHWKDEKFKRKTVYPGVRALYKALDKEKGNIAFITARPKDRGGITERLTRRALSELGFPSPVVLTGRWHQLHSSSAIAERKWKNFVAYQRLYPNRKFVFFGDSGQKDAVFAQRLWESGYLRLGLIHCIEPARSETWKGQFPDLHFFDTYTKAAQVCLEEGLISKKEALWVLEENRRELSESFSVHPLQRRDEFIRDRESLLRYIR